MVARNLDSANDTLTVLMEGSPNQVEWASVGEASSDKKIDESDFSTDPESGAETASVTFTASYHEYIRARVSSLTDNAGGDLEVDAWIMAGGNAGQGRKGYGRQGPVTDL